jgi:hypothetical protein
LNAGSQKPLAGARHLSKQTASVANGGAGISAADATVACRQREGIRRITAPISSGVVRV